MSITFDAAFEGEPGEAVLVGPEIRRVTAPNGGPYTFKGTNTYLIGSDRLAIIDPGPDDDRHLDALLGAVAGHPVEAIFVTHTHLDHTALVARLVRETGAPTIAEGPHRAARPLHAGETNGLDAADDLSFLPDRSLADGDVVELAAGRFRAVATPGHTVNHMAYALDGTGVLFSGDHVMAWSTTVIAPPDGAMGAFMTSLDKLLGRDDTLYLPGHGGPVRNPRRFVRALIAHRRIREAAIRERLAAGDRTVAAVTETLYSGIDPRLRGAAALSVFAHLEDLIARGLVETDGPAVEGGTFRPA